MTAREGGDGVERIEVTAEDIQLGVPQDPKACAVALALRRHFLRPVTVTAAAIEIKGRPPLRASGILARWLWLFDHQRELPPTVVELSPEEGTADLAGPPPGVRHAIGMTRSR